MVVNKKLPVTPSMGSRTNSSQPLARAKPTSNFKQVSTAGPSPKKSKPKKSTKPSKTSTSSSIVDRLIVYVLAVFSLYALWSCPSDTNLANPVCRSLSHYRTHVLDPYVLPPIHKALSHPSIAPAVIKFYDAERVVTPVIRRTHEAAQPYISKATKLAQATAVKVVVPIYNRHIYPLLQKYVLPEYRRHVLPRVHLVQSRVIDPYFTPFMLKARLYANSASRTSHRMYLSVAPRVHDAYIRAHPHLARVRESLQPHVLKVAEIAAKFFAMAYEKFGDARRQFVDPHVVRIWAKVVELSGSTATSSTFVAASYTSPSVAETQATSSETEPETIQSSTSSVASATTSAMSPTLSAVTEASSEAFVPDDSSIPVETSTTEEQAETSSVSPSSASTELETPPTPSSIIADAPEAPKVADDEPEIDLFTESESEIVSPTEAQSVVPSPTDTTSVQDDDLDDFFAAIGLVDDQEPIIDEDFSVVEEPATTTTTLTPEESAEARRVATAEKRTKLEARMEKWHLDLDALVKRRTKAFRKELVRIRKGAVRALFPDPEKDDNGDLEEALTHIRGEDVAGILGRFEKDSEKLLKGLVSYLRKEEKAVSDSSTLDFDDRMKRWYNVAQRVEEKFTESLTELQDKVHWWYLEVRELEVQEYHRATADVKNLAGEAQADMGMPMAWLDDVTYQDWQRYHDLMRAHTRFDEQIRMIQNGTHPSPPIDPLIPALDKLERDLEDIKNGFSMRLRALGSEIHEILAPKPAEGENVSPSGEEDKVSILPIDPLPVQGNQEEFDASNIIIGKSKEQVEEAMSMAEEPVHEEL